MKGLNKLTAAAATVILTSGLAFVGCGNEKSVTGPVTLSEDPAEFCVSGYVYDSGSGLPIAYVNLKFYDAGYIGETYTSSGPPGSPTLGYYGFELGPGRLGHQIWVYASKPGYFSNWTWFIYWPGPSYVHDIYIVPLCIHDDPPPK